MNFLFYLLCSFVLTVNAWASIGNVILHEGTGAVERTDGEEAVTEIDLDIFSYDTIKTGNGKTAIEFVDDTRVDVTQHSKLIIDEFVYDPNAKTGKLSLKASLGTVRYASGQIAKNSRQDVLIQTPTATIGVRGTDFAMTIDEIGSSTIILLPSCNTNGQCYVGEISVESDAGQVIMNQAFRATVVDTVSSPPMKPVILSLEEDMINNLLIVSKPTEIQEQMDSSAYNEVANALDIDFLEQNFLVDILDQINKELARQMRDEFDKKGGAQRFGKDPETGIIFLDEDPQFVWSREDAAGNFIELRLDKENTYILNVQQQDYEIIDYTINGQENEINILQNQ